MIGGTDIVFWVRDDIPPVDVILRTVRRHWPHYVFQDADNPVASTQAAGPCLPTPSGREFFLFVDGAAARSWYEFGATPENFNSMLYVILGNRRQPDARLRSLTLVCGELAGEIEKLVSELEEGFRFLDASPPSFQEAA